MKKTVASIMFSLFVALFGIGIFLSEAALTEGTYNLSRKAWGQTLIIDYKSGRSGLEVRSRMYESHRSEADDRKPEMRCVKSAPSAVSGIGAAAVRCGQHGDDFFLIVDLVKKTPGTDSISPCFRLKILELFDMRSKMGVFPKLRINEIQKLSGDLAVTA